MIPQPFSLNGRTGTIVYLDAQWHPVTPEQATMAKVVFDDGGVAFYVTESRQKAEGLGGLTRKFDAAQHPRGHDGRFIEATEPRIFNRPSELMESKGWGGDPVRFVWKDPKTGESTGRLLTGEPLARETLPETLYHVTTNAPAVEASGVLLGLLEDGGLGGGQAPGVSMTSSKEAATLIQRELRRAVTIARGEADETAIEQYAREDEQSAGLPKGSLDYAVEQAKQAWEGNKHILNKYVEGQGYTGTHTPAERERIRRSVLKDVFNSYLWARETAAEKVSGQPVPSLKNPILFGRQEQLAKLKPEDIRTLEVPSAQIPEGALITTGSDTFLHEVRTYSDVPLRKRLQSISKFEEAQHPREEKGSPQGGEFKSTGASSDPRLAEQAKAGIAAVEKLLPEAITTADFSKTTIGSVQAHSWGETDEAVRKEVMDKFLYGDKGNTTTGRIDQWEKKSDVEKYLLMDYYGIWAKPMSKDVSGYLPEQWVTGVDTGERGDEDYERTHAIALRLTELRTDEIRQERGLAATALSQVPTYTIRPGMVPADEELKIPKTEGFVAIDDLTGKVIATAYDEQQATINAESWVVDTVAGREIVTKDLISDVWQAWKQKSSEGLGLSLQLAAARELGGVHRMTDEEVDAAERYARSHGGIATLQAYVRAQWEVTQMIMAKAGAQKLDVYRAILLPGESVKTTPKERLGPQGQVIAPPANVKVLEQRVEAGQDSPDKPPLYTYVTFDYNGETFSAQKMRVMPKSWDDVPPDTQQRVKELWGERMGGHVNAAEVKWHEQAFESNQNYNKLAMLRMFVGEGKLPPFPFESTEATVERRVDEYHESQSGEGQKNVFIQLPDLQLKRAGAQSTTGASVVANNWDGVGTLPNDPKRVVVRIEAPPTSVLSLPVYGQNAQEEHESVLVGTRDKWVWDAWLSKAPQIRSVPVGHRVHKADTPPLVIDLQAEDRGKPHWLSSVNWATVTKKDAAFDESKHPREPGGTSEGGRFTESGHAGETTPDPVLAEQAKVGIAAVEKLIPEAIQTADFTTVAPSDAWDNLSETVQDKTKDKWLEDAYGDVEVDTSQLDKDTKEEVQKENQKILDQSVEDLGKMLKVTDPFVDLAPTLPIEGEPFQLHRTLDLDSIDYGYGDHEDDNTVKLDLDALRFTSGEPLTPDEQTLVKQHWDARYEANYEKALEDAYQSSSYEEQRSQLQDEQVQQEWDDLSDSDKMDLARQYGYDKAVHRADPGEPDHWTTGVETGTHQEDDYARTHAIAQQLTLLRTDELRKERGLLGPREKPTYTIVPRGGDFTPDYPSFTVRDADGRIIASADTEQQAKAKADKWANEQAKGTTVTSENIIDRVWADWKSSSSSGMSLSLQLAAAREFNGVHRLTPEELAEAEYHAKPFGGIETLQAYVRAQWEVTQTIMAKAKEDKMRVYRAIYLPGEEVKKTAQVPVDKLGGPVVRPKPTNITVRHTGENPMVTFEYDGREMHVEKQKTGGPKSIVEIGTVPITWESDESAVQRKIEHYHTYERKMGDMEFTKLPELQLKRAGAQSTTGTRRVANDWGGVGGLPPDPVRVVIRVEAPPTSVLSLPVYGQNVTEEHESVLIGTRDHWLWDAWRDRAPEFGSQPVSSTTRKAETKPLVVDLQAEDRGKPHWMSTVDWATILRGETVQKYASILKWDPNQPRNPKGMTGGGRWMRGGGSGSFYGTRILPSSTEADRMPAGIAKVIARGRRAGRIGAEERERQEERDRAKGSANYADIMNAPMGTGFGNVPRLTGDPEMVKRLTTPVPEKGAESVARALALETANAASSHTLGEGEHANVALKVTLDDANGTEAVFKPEVGEAWTGAFANSDISDYVTNRDFSLAEREAFAYEVDTALGLGLVPETVHRKTLDGVDLGNLPSSEGDYQDSYELRERYDEYKEKAQEQAMDVVSEEMGRLFDEAQDEHVKDIKNRTDELTDIWNELIDNEFSDLPTSEELAAQREHPTLPMGSMQPFERRPKADPLDPLEILDKANVNTEGDISEEERTRVEAVMRDYLKAGGEDLGDLDEDAAREHLDRDRWIEDHQDTENRLYESKIQDFNSWKQSQGYGSRGGGSSDVKNPHAPHPQGGSLQMFVENLDSFGDATPEETRKLAVLDYAIGTMDRHPNNVAFANAKLVAIDNGYSMPDVNVPDGFVFRSDLIRRWKKYGGDDKLVPKPEREKILASLNETDWEALLKRHPNMTLGERRAFLGRIENLREALKYDAGLKDLWSGMNVM